MNILITINDEFVDVTLDMLNSVHLYNPEKLEIYLIYKKINAENIEKMKKYIEKNNIGNLYPIYVNFSEDNFQINIGHITKETYFRLYAPYILPPEIDRILYLDGDLICNGSIRDLYDTPFDGNIFAACENVDPDPHFIPWINSRLELPLDNIYYNAGVLLINTKEYRKFVTVEQLNKFIEDNKEKIWCQDQDVINKLFNKKIKHMDDTYNYQVNHIDALRLKYNKKIVHYLSGPKPWKKDYFLPFQGIAYYKYLMKTEQSDKAMELIDLHIKNAGLSNIKIDFFKYLLKNMYK